MSHDKWRVRAYRAGLVAFTAYCTLVACVTDADEDYDYPPPDYAPQVQITSPGQWAEFTVGDQIRFEGTAQDDEDGALQGDDLIWTSDLQGAIGTGSPLTVFNLQIGLHKITLSASDRKNQTGSSHLYIRVLPESYGGENQPPVVTLISPENYTHYAPGETIVLEATVEDPEEGPLTGSSLEWSASGPGVRKWPGNRVEVSDLPVGSWEIWLRAVDRFGKSGSSRYLYITVGAVDAGTCEGEIDPSPVQVAPAASGTVNVQVEREGPFEPMLRIEVEDGADPVSDVFASVTAHGSDGSWPAWFEYTANPLLVANQTHELMIRAYVFDEEQPYTCTMPLTVVTRAAGANTAPEATIDSPQDDTGVYAGTAVTFTGTGTDLEDGTLTGSSLVWESSIDGQIGTGVSFQRNDLSLGVHTITLRVTDSDGAIATATIQLSVLEQGNYAAITGTVTYSGAPVPGVFVMLSGAASASTVTSAQGYYYFPNLAAGTYTVTITDYPAGMTFTTTSTTITIGPYDYGTVNFTN